MPKGTITDRPVEAIRVALIVAVVCALAVSSAAVFLRPYYAANLEAQREARLGSILETVQTATTRIELGDIQMRVVHLETGVYDPAIDPASYDARRAAADPSQSTVIAREFDHAGIKRRENHAVVYIVPGQNLPSDIVILPIWGVGYQSAIYGYIALTSDNNEILGFKVYQHGETPGLGSRIQNPQWEDQWKGKRAIGEAGQVVVHVGSRNDGYSADRVDAITGATRTSMGIDGMVKFWLGDLGFGPYLDRLRRTRS